MIYAMINSFHFRNKNKYLIVRKCLYRDSLQIVRNQSGMLRVHRSEYLSTLSNKNYVRCQILFVYKHCLVIKHGSLNFRVANL